LALIVAGVWRRFSSMRPEPYDNSHPVGLLGGHAALSERIRGALDAASIHHIVEFDDAPAALEAMRLDAIGLLVACWDGEDGPVGEMLACAAAENLFAPEAVRLIVVTRRISLVGAARRLGASMVVRSPFEPTIFPEILARLGTACPRVASRAQ
jgi:hypothetical protein